MGSPILIVNNKRHYKQLITTHTAADKNTDNDTGPDPIYQTQYSMPGQITPSNWMHVMLP